MIYRYIIDSIIGFFNNKERTVSEKYYISFDEQKEVEEFYNRFKENNSVKNFTYYNDSVKEEYKTIIYETEKNKFIISAALDGIISKDFLVTLRNSIGYERYEDYSILFIYQGDLDSLSRGAISMMDLDMPLNINYIKTSLESEFRDKIDSKIHKNILTVLLDKTIKDYATSYTNIFDFEVFLRILHNQKIKNEDYKEFNLFPYQNNNENATISQLKRDLEKNEKFYSDVLRAHNYGDKEYLNNNFLGDVKNKLLDNEHWEDVHFNEVIASHESAMEKADISYIDQTKGTCITKTNENLMMWDIAEKETKVGKRTRNIIIFDGDDMQEISFSLKFNKNVTSEYVKKGDGITTVIGKHLLVKLDKESKTKFNYIEYMHENKNTSLFKIKIVVLPMLNNHLPFLTSDVRLIKPHISKKQISMLQIRFEDELLIGKDNEYINQVISESDNNVFELSESSYRVKFIYEELEEFVDLRFKRKDFCFIIRVVFDEEKVKKTVNASTLFSKKIQFAESYKRKNESTLTRGLNSYVVSSKKLAFMLKVESNIVNNEAQYLELIDDSNLIRELRIPTEIKASYQKLCRYMKDNNSLPLLDYWSEEYNELVKEHMELFFSVVERLNSDAPIPEEFKDILFLGAVKHHERIYFTSLHILNLIYLDKINLEYNKPIFETRFNDFINPSSLVPYFYHIKNLYKRINDIEMSGWIEYQLDNKSDVKDTRYLKKIVKEKALQYTKHFNHLFKNKTSPKMVINLVQISDINSCTIGILDLIVQYIKDNRIVEIPKFVINIYCDDIQLNNYFDLLNKISDIDVLEERMNYNFSLNTIDRRDVLGIVRNHTDVIYNYESYPDTYVKSHICFTEMRSIPAIVDSKMDQLNTGIFMNGLTAEVALTKILDHYQVGVGTKNLDVSNDFVKRIISLNELALNAKGDYKSTYKKGLCIALDIHDTYNYQNIFDNSDWVTFISPDVELSFFNELSEKSLILHYNDQYTNNVAYDAITMTRNTDIYGEILKSFLTENKYMNKEKDIKNIINSFSAVNGEWLLKMLSADEKYTREKISIVSSLKHMLAYLDNPDYLWIPISLEEILRVSGAVGLSGTNGIFSVKSLDKHGAKSDDFLLLGLTRENDKTKITFVPVEVKIGINDSSVMKKAKEQIKNTFDTLKEFLYDNEGEKELQSNILIYFFLQLGISAYKKLITFGVIDKENELFDMYMKDAINGNYKLVNYKVFGNGIIYSFKNNFGATIVKSTDEEFIIEMNSDIAFTDLGKSIEDIRMDNKSLILLDVYKKMGEESFLSVEENINGDIVDVDNEKINDVDIELSDIDKESNHKSSTYNIEEENLTNYYNIGIDPSIAADKEEKYSVNEEQNFSEINSRILLGTSKIIKDNIYWEFTNEGLQNRHLLITGSSGSGKTYAIQTLLYEVSKNNIPVVIFDYTDGFTKAQLDNEFLNKTEDKIEYHLIIRDKLGINPFSRFPMKIAGFEKLEEPFQVAQRVAATFKNVYSFKEQQYSAIYEAVKNGIDELDDRFSLNSLVDNLKASENKSAITVMSKILPFIDSNIFDINKKVNWSDIKKSGKIHIFQLTGYNREIQTLITELVLWDMWNYSVLNGKESEPFIVVLDEAQNISHSESSPSGKILTEGRKFGISGWYATQFLKNAVTNDEIQRLQQASQKLYFRPTDSGVDEVAGYLSSEKDEIQKWKLKSLNLKKGQCISVGYGLEMNQLKRYTPQIINITSFDDRK